MRKDMRQDIISPEQPREGARPCSGPITCLLLTRRIIVFIIITQYTNHNAFQVRLNKMAPVYWEFSHSV